MDENTEERLWGALTETVDEVRHVKQTFGEGTPDPDLLSAAADRGWVLLTRDSDFTDPPIDDHAGVLVVTETDVRGGLSGDDLETAVSQILRQYPDLSGEVAYVTDWLD